MRKRFNINDLSDDNEDDGYAGYMVKGGHNHRENSFKLKVDIPNFVRRMSIEETIDLVSKVEWVF